jgi:putative ABC transport system permease protein
MLRHNFKAALSFIRRNLIFTIINISGLSLGLVLVVFLLLWLQFEFSFDKFNKNSDRIFRVVSEVKYEASGFSFAGTPAQLGETVKNAIPEVADYVRLGSLGRLLVSYGERQFFEEIELADPSIFRIFTFPLLSGDAASALNNPNSLVISKSKARKYFGDENPLGKTIYLGYRLSPFIITGIMNDIPSNSQLKFDFLGSFSQLKNNLSWANWNYTTYLLARDKDSYASISKKLPGLLNDIPNAGDHAIHIQPLTSVHLYSHLNSDLASNRNINTIYVIGSILILVLIVACINYMNLATARFTKRGKEASLRKVAGATNEDLTQQFLFESFTVTLSAFVIAFVICLFLMPVFGAITGVSDTSGLLFKLKSIVEFAVLIIVISLISGSYPAFLIASSPSSALRNDINTGKVLSIKGLRKGLIIFQFFITISLIACTLIFHSQMEYIRNKNLGLSPDQVIVVSLSNPATSKKYGLYKNEILKYPAVQSASAMSYFPGTQGYYQNVWWEGLNEADNNNSMSWISVDQDFIKTLKLRLLSGEDFPENMVRDSLNLYILNESALKMTGWSNAGNKQFEIIGPKKRGKVIGIVKDFNFKSLYNNIEPVALICYPLLFDNLMVKISGKDLPSTISYLHDKWNTLFPQTPFEYSFLSDDFQKMYEKENRTLNMITWISIISLFISCIGLFGLVLFTLDCRVKEIGIRKAAGSTSGGIVIMLNLEFIKWIIVSFALACPLVIILMHKWLQSFAYRTSLNWLTFAAAGVITIIMSLLTVSWHTMSIASTNPSKCLKHE